MSKRIPDNPTTDLDKLRLIRKEIFDAHFEYEKKMIRVMEKLNYIIKEKTK